MEWPADFPEDHAFVEPPVPGLPSELDFEQLLKDAEEKLNLNANRLVGVAKALTSPLEPFKLKAKELCPNSGFCYLDLTLIVPQLLLRVLKNLTISGCYIEVVIPDSFHFLM